MAGLGALLPGCGPLFNTARTLIFEPMQYCQADDNITDRVRGRQLGKSAFYHLCKANPDKQFSKDYGRGFVDGFAKYLYSGGTGAPPPVPPMCYWEPKYDTPAGHQAIEDWYAGYRHGSWEARRSGLRELITIPASAPAESASQQEQPQGVNSSRSGTQPAPAAGSPPRQPEPTLPPPGEMPVLPPAPAFEPPADIFQGPPPSTPNDVRVVPNGPEAKPGLP